MEAGAKERYKEKRFQMRQSNVERDNVSLQSNSSAVKRTDRIEGSELQFAHWAGVIGQRVVRGRSAQRYSPLSSDLRRLPGGKKSRPFQAGGGLRHSRSCRPYGMKAPNTCRQTSGLQDISPVHQAYTRTVSPSARAFRKALQAGNIAIKDASPVRVTRTTRSKTPGPSPTRLTPARAWMRGARPIRPA